VEGEKLRSKKGGRREAWEDKISDHKRKAGLVVKMGGFCMEKTQKGPAAKGKGRRKGNTKREGKPMGRKKKKTVNIFPSDRKERFWSFSGRCFVKINTTVENRRKTKKKHPRKEARLRKGRGGGGATRKLKRMGIFSKRTGGGI